MSLLFGDKDRLVVQDAVLQASRANEEQEDVRHFRLLESHARHWPRRVSPFNALDANFDATTRPKESKNFSDRHIPEIHVDGRGVLHTFWQRGLHALCENTNREDECGYDDQYQRTHGPLPFI